MEGNNIGKVEPGSMMIVKSDTDGPIRDLIKVKVLEIVKKQRKMFQIKRRVGLKVMRLQEENLL